ncbi:MAG: hypothetical protein AAGB10_09650 [Pseudomonadota bacterium]
MKTTVFAAAALAVVAAAPLSAAGFDYDVSGLNGSQKAQVFAVLNGDENNNTKQRLIDAISSDRTVSQGVTRAAQTANVLNGDENENTKARLIQAINSDRVAPATQTISKQFGTSLSAAQKAQIFAIENGDENENTKARLISAILN